MNDELKLQDDERQGLPSASEMHRIMACPGYWQAKRNWPKRQDIATPAATMGDRIHEAMEYIVDGQAIELTLTEREEWITDKCAMLKAQIEAEFFGPGKIDRHHVEERRWVTSSATGKRVASAKSDYIGSTPDGWWLILDYKSGPKEVAAADANWQIATAALTILNDQELMRQRPMKGVFGAIIQPLVTLQPKLVKFSVEDLTALHLQMSKQFRVIDLPDQPRIPGPHCAYCPVSHACFEAQATGVILTKRFAALGHMTPLQLVELRKLIPSIRSCCDDVTDFIKQKLEFDPESVPGLELREESSGHMVANKTEFLKALMPTITKEEFWPMLTVPVAEIRNLWIDRSVAASGGQLTKKVALIAWNERFVPLMQEKPKRKVIREKKNEPPSIAAKATA